MKTRSLLFSSILLTTVSGHTSTYQYGGACGTQGSWTQAALSRTSELKGYLQKLKDDPNCKVLPQVLQKSFAELETQVNTSNNLGNDSELTELPKEISALRTYGASEPEFKGQIAGAMTSKLVRQAVVEGSGKALETSTKLNSRSGIDFLRKRATSFNAGLGLVGQLVDNLPAVERCMDNSGNFGHYLAATIQLVGSFSASGMDQNGAGVAKLVSKLAEHSRDQKYASALKTLDQNEYLAALACLLELTSESYCAARDGQLLFQDMLKTTQVVTDAKGELSLRGMSIKAKAVGQFHPLEGYYILTQNLPIITGWLQSVQLGVEPRLPTDSDQKNKPLVEINNFYISVNNLRGVFNLNAENIKNLKVLEEKKNLIVRLVEALTNSMANMGGQNFFTISHPAVHIPFKLIGIDTPAAVMGIGGNVQQGPIQFLDANVSTLGAFNDADALMAKIKINMDTIIRSADINATAYYGKWFIVDKIAIVNRAMIGNLYNVKESLSEINSYLKNLELKIKKYSGDKSLLPGIRDTRMRIEKVMVRFKKVEEVGASLQNLNLAESSSEVLESSEDLIKEVFDQFYVMLAKSGWLANRLVDFVEYDYDLMLRSGVDMNSNVAEIYLATGRSMVNNIISMSSGNPASVSADLALSLRINKGNLEALEKALASSYVDQIAFLKHIVEGRKQVSSGSIWDMKNNSQGYGVDEIPGNYNNPVARYLYAFWKDGLNGFGSPTHMGATVKNLFSWLKVTKISPDDEFGSARKVMNQLCTQTLAFGDLNPFWYLCRDTKMESPFLTINGNEISAQAKKILNVNYKDKAWESYKESRQLNHSLRICALRDFSRKNFVLYLLQGQASKD